jgi:hypothetical protein
MKSTVFFDKTLPARGQGLHYNYYDTTTTVAWSTMLVSSDDLLAVFGACI